MNSVPLIAREPVRPSIRWRPILALAAVAALAAWFWPAAEDSDIAEPVRRTETRPAAAPHSGTPVRLAFPQRKVQAVSLNLFERHSWYRPPPPAPVAPPGPPPAPSAPPLPFSYLGQYERAGDHAVYFLVNGDRVYDVRVGDVLDKTYSIDAAANGALQFTYLPLQTKQSLSIGSSQ